MKQSDLDDLADNLQVRFEVLDNISDGQKKFKAQIVLTNHSSHTLTSADKWAIYFCLMRMIEPDALPEAHSCLNEESQVIFSHINGCLFKLEPATEFEALTPGSAIGIKFHAQRYCVAKTDIFPNWYLTAPNCQPRLIRSTVDETLSFVADFDSPVKWKRFDHPTPSGQKFDHYNPFTPEERFERNARASESVKVKPVIPTPLNVKYTDDEYVELSRDSWVIYCDSALVQEANYLAEKVSLPIHDSLPASGKEYIELRVAPGELCDLGGEGYHLTVAPEKPFIQIIGADHPGVFYGVQTLLQLLDNKHRVPQVQIRDAPRFEYRGMHLDVVRNFHDVDSVKLLIEAMAMYKLNKLHLHLTDDEGWRIEIPGLHELTQIGGRVGHDLTETTCILPVLGSGPDMKSGFYSVQDYQEILRYAKDRHVEIIPEIDMPGHAHAAIKSMCVRYSKSGENLSGEFSLAGEREGKDHHSVQKYVNNAFDPGLESTFNFIDKVIQELVKMHAQVSPLKLFHFGGDEVPMELWQTYIACQKLIKKGVVKEESKLMEYFVTRVSQLTQKYGLNLGAWQDGILFEDKSLIERKKLENTEVFTYAWLNRWELGLADSGNRLANAGYKVVMAPGTHLYFDHPYEPDPEERGLYWASRYIDTFKTFKYMPLNCKGNSDEKLTGEPITEADFIKGSSTYESLDKPENIIGIQGQLWSETVRNRDQLHQLVFPRLLALAERAWHKADWEWVTEKAEREEAMLLDWSSFAGALGQRELRHLDNLGITYHIPLPGARLDGDVVMSNTAYPGLSVDFSEDEGRTWQQLKNGTSIKQDTILLQTRSADNQRTSRSVCLKRTE